MIFVCDLHVHIGAASGEQAVKITASRDLTFENIAKEAVERKGIDVVGVIDCASPAVIADIEAMLDSGEMVELDGGGLRYRDEVTIILGAELETREDGGGMSHNLSYFRTFESLKGFSETMHQYVTNMNLSSQSCGLPAKELFQVASAYGAFFVPAHAFTPHKSHYGACTMRMGEMFADAWHDIPAIELGLSADAYLADRIDELSGKSLLSNSDAHSRPKIGREYNLIEMESACYDELLMALWREEGRRVEANFGLDPRLGKYHRTFCEDCQHTAVGEPPVEVCERCNSDNITRGVLDRIVQIADYDEPHPPDFRAPYQYQVPLQFVPGVGTVTLNRLINHFGSEMAVLHQATREEIGQVVGQKIADLIIQAREGTLPLKPGGGGRYGKALAEKDNGQITLPGIS
ncbi:MAG: endonuclease Q family protein [Armatimonadota bacterium]